MGKTLYQKVYDSHIVFQQEGELPTLYIDRQLVHEVTSPQAFAGIEQAVSYTVLICTWQLWIMTFQQDHRPLKPAHQWLKSRSKL